MTFDTLFSFKFWTLGSETVHDSHMKEVTKKKFELKFYLQEGVEILELKHTSNL